MERVPPSPWKGGGGWGGALGHCSPTPHTHRTHAAASSLPFAVSRTPSAQLPVYRMIRAGGTHISTRIQHVEGSAQALRRELVEAAGIPGERVAVNPVSGHVECKGDYVTAVKQHLQRLGF